MSLILRKECQTILDEHGFDDYHVSIEVRERYDKTRVLGIVGPCGQVLFKINGISFSRINPTAKEIEYAVILLHEFFLMHKRDIDSFKKAQKAFFDLRHHRALLEDKEGWKAAIQTNTVISVTYGTKVESLTFFPEHAGSGWEYHQRAYGPLSAIGKLAKDKTVRANIVDRAKKLQNYCAARAAYNKAKEKLTTCEI